MQEYASVLIYCCMTAPPLKCCAFAQRIQGSRGVLSICLLLPWLSTVPHSASPDKQLHKWTRESLLATSMLQLNACFLFMVPSTPLNFRNSLIMFFLAIQLVFINLFYMYSHVTP